MSDEPEREFFIPWCQEMVNKVFQKYDPERAFPEPSEPVSQAPEKAA